MEIYSHVRTPQRPQAGSERRPVHPEKPVNGTKSGGTRPLADDEDSTGSSKLIQTLTACNRCRQRKTKCDVGLPKCGPCQRARPPVDCKFWDAERENFISRTYIVSLQQKAKALELEYRQRTASKNADGPPNVEDLVRSMGLVSLADEEPEPHYLGSSAGLQLARLVVEFAKEKTRNHSVEDIVPSSEHESAKEQGKERRPSFPALSAQPMMKLPHKEVAIRLITEFIFKRAQFMLPTLHEPSFMALTDDIYAGSQDAHQNFTFRIVLAISMHKLGTQYSALADSYYLAALQHLEGIITAMSLDTLQCFCLMGQYSLLTPTRTGIYHIIGLATRLCIDLGLSQEKTIKHNENGVPYDPLTLDMRRRLFWVTMSMESGLSHILGRPSGFCTGDYFTDVEFYQPVDDVYITKEKVMPASKSMKKLMSMHFFRMRIIQAEIRRTLYTNARPNPKSDEDPWFKDMYAKLDAWVKYAPQNEEGLGLTRKWYNNMLIFLYRPSPQIPEPSIEATILCYNCAIENITIQKRMFEDKTSDLTWVLVHQVYMTCIIMMWCLSCKRIRELHGKEEVASHIQTGMDCLDMLVERWPGVGSAKEIFSRLSYAALQSYSHDTDLSMFKQFLPGYEQPQSVNGHNETAYESSPAPTYAALSQNSPASVGQYTSSPPMTPNAQSPDYQSPHHHSIPSPHTSPALTNAAYSPQYQSSNISQSSPPPNRSSFRHSYQGSELLYSPDLSYPNYVESISSVTSRHPSMMTTGSSVSHNTAGMPLNTLNSSTLPNLSDYHLASYSMDSMPHSETQAQLNLHDSPNLAPHQSQLDIRDAQAQTQEQNLSIPALSQPAIPIDGLAAGHEPSMPYPNYPNPFFTMPQPGHQIYNGNSNNNINGVANLLNYPNQPMDNMTGMMSMYGAYNADLLQQDEVNDLMENLETDSYNNFPAVPDNPYAAFY